MSSNKGKKVSNQSCCVVDCKSKYGGEEKISFYSFPNRPWEKERRKTWIVAVRRLT